eukprot:gnl/MRDRNA2_/MRDRNA2_28446_c0_seq1.p1 gnl/MRDRNA2_/MRDRNA2_28446_c0~~gnl/MRDRNA2_/MRDRNA2_28446_c0_seq1.p1  ORF type:complete len:103 (-),score=28.16 gnl/MRDRNA2_/MRDRNA2_28446_c0_seq1:335-643(-)
MAMEACSIFIGVFDAFDLWIIVPFLLGYFSWKFLFVGMDIRYDKLEAKYIEDDAVSTVSSDDEDEKPPAREDISSELQRLREEILRERAQADKQEEPDVGPQ